MADDTIREDVVKRFHSIPGLGLSKAEMLFDSGYTTLTSLKRATVEDLSTVKGINPPLARYILREVKDMKEGVEATPVESETAAAPSGDDDTASITVGEAVSTEGTEEVEGTEEPSAEDEAGEGGGFLGGFVNTIKSFFGGGGEEKEVDDEEAPVEGEAVEEEMIEEEAPSEEESPEAEEEPEAQIQVGDEPKEPETEPGTEEEAKVDEEAEPEPMPDEPPSAEPEERSLVSDIKAKGLARIKALRERIYGKKKEDEEPPKEDIEEPLPEGPEEEAEEEKPKEEVEEEPKEEVKEKRSRKTSKKTESGDKELVDNIIKELDLDGEGS